MYQLYKGRRQWSEFFGCLFYLQVVCIPYLNVWLMQIRKAGALDAFQGHYPSSGRLTRYFLECINPYLNTMLSNSLFSCICIYLTIYIAILRFMWPIWPLSRTSSEYSSIMYRLYKGRRQWSEIFGYFFLLVSSMYFILMFLIDANSKSRSPLRVSGSLPFIR